MLKFITPKFIKKLDTFLVANYPVIWISKIHYVLWHGLMLWTVSFLAGLLVPVDLREDLAYGLWYFLFTVLGITVLCTWIYNFVIFNKEKNYGSKKITDDYLNFTLTFITVFIFLSAPWPFEMIYNHRVANSFTDKEIFNDINTLNETAPYTLADVQMFNAWTERNPQRQYFNVKALKATNFESYTPGILVGDSLSYPKIISWNQLVKNYKVILDKTELVSKLNAFTKTASKYNVEVLFTSEVQAEEYLALTEKDKILLDDYTYKNNSYKYMLGHVFTNVCEAKFETLFIFNPESLWTLFYFVISISTFLILFKMTYWRQFLLLLTILILYPIVAFIFSQLLSSGYHSNTIYTGSLLALMILGMVYVLISVQKQERFVPFSNIMCQVFYVTMIYFPFLLVVFLHDHTNLFHKIDYSNYESSKPLENQLDYYLASYWQNQYQTWKEIAVFGGIGLFLLCLPLFKELFTKQLALPKKT